VDLLGKLSRAFFGGDDPLKSWPSGTPFEERGLK